MTHETLDTAIPARSLRCMPKELIHDEQQDELDDVESQALGASTSAAVLASSDWTTQTILDQLKRGNIDLNPVFQRRDAWTAARKSRFIESLILGFPVPQLVLAERKDRRGKYIVIDGKQRLLTLRRFASEPDDTVFEPLSLEGLKVLPHLNGLTYSQLQDRLDLDGDLTAFENQTIRTVVIKNWPNENFLYAVFLRLNTGSVQLSPQELRQALHPGEFSQWVNEYAADSEPLHRVLRIDGPDFRMRDAELVIRFLAFRDFLPQYTGNLKPLLDKVVEVFNEKWVDDRKYVEARIAEFERAVGTALQVFGDDAFRKWNGTEFETQINRAVFDVMTQYFGDAEVVERVLPVKGQVVQEFKRLCVADSEFRAAIERTTKTVGAIHTRLTKWASSLSSVTGATVTGPRLDGKRLTWPSDA